MAVTIVTKDGLKNDLADFRNRGDERWARTSQISSLVDEALDGKDVLVAEDMSGLTDDEMSELLGMI